MEAAYNSGIGEAQMHAPEIAAKDPMALCADRLIGTKVYNHNDEHLGKIEDIILTPTGGVAYFVLSYGGILGTNYGDKHFAIPFSAFTLEEKESKQLHCQLNVEKSRLENAPGFDKENPPAFADPQFSRTVGTYFRDYSACQKEEVY